MIVVGAILASLIGITLGLLGAGGGILTVPLLHYVLGFEMRDATAASLVIVGVTALAAAVLYARRGLVHLVSALAFALPSAAGMILSRTILLPMIPERALFPGGFVFDRNTIILIPFAFVMMAAGRRMLRTGPKPASPAPSDGRPDKNLRQSAPRSRLRTLLAMLSGAAIGLLSGFVGAGGGFLIVPALNLGLGVAMGTAIGTSLVVIALNSLIGVASDLGMGYVADWQTITIMTLMSLLGMGLGVRLASRIDATKLKPAFGIFMIIMAGIIVAKEIIQ